MVIAVPISPHVFLVRAPIGIGFVAIYIVVGRRVALVDTGFAHHSRDAIEPALESLGLSFHDVDLVLTTHAHPDHVGGHARVAAASNARVGFHSTDRDRFTGAIERIVATDEFMLAFRRLDLDGRASERKALLVAAGADNIAARQHLDDNDRIDLGGGVAIEVVHTPGHTLGALSFMIRPDGTVLVGDAMQCLGGSAGLPLYQDPGAYRSSLARLNELRATRMGLGHPFRSAVPDEQAAIVAGSAIDAKIGESDAFPVIAQEAARAVLATRPRSLADAVHAFLQWLPPPFNGIDASLDEVGAASLHAALLHLDRERAKRTGNESTGGDSLRTC